MNLFKKIVLSMFVFINIVNANSITNLEDLTSEVEKVAKGIIPTKDEYGNIDYDDYYKKLKKGISEIDGINAFKAQLDVDVHDEIKDFFKDTREYKNIGNYFNNISGNIKDRIGLISKNIKVDNIANNAGEIFNSFYGNGNFDPTEKFTKKNYIDNFLGTDKLESIISKNITNNAITQGLGSAINNLSNSVRESVGEYVTEVTNEMKATIKDFIDTYNSLLSTMKAFDFSNSTYVVMSNYITKSQDKLSLEKDENINKVISIYAQTLGYDSFLNNRELHKIIKEIDGIYFETISLYSKANIIGNEIKLFNSISDIKNQNSKDYKNVLY